MLAVFITLDPAALRIVIASFVLCLSAVAHAQTPASQGPGQVSVVISVEGLRIPDVQVELRDLERNVVVARTTADAIGQVTFSDVPAGRYMVEATREGFADAESSPFDVHGGVDRTGPDRDAPHLHPRERGGDPAGQLAHREPAAGGGERPAHRREDGHSAAGRRRLSVAVDDVAGHRSRSRGTAAREGRRADDGRAAGEQRQPERPSTGDFDLELPSGAVESVEVLSNPFAAEYGRFSTSVTQVRTRRGTTSGCSSPAT